MLKVHLESLATRCDQAAYVGDSEGDMRMAKGAGVSAWGVGWSSVTRGTLRKAGADRILGGDDRAGSLTMRKFCPRPGGLVQRHLVAGRNLSCNWRLILAPDFVLRYLVTHETVHLAVPDHSAKFWLTLQSLCPGTERAKQWLSTNGLRLAVKLDSICGETDRLQARDAVPRAITKSW